MKKGNKGKKRKRMKKMNKEKRRKNMKKKNKEKKRRGMKKKGEEDAEAAAARALGKAPKVQPPTAPKRKTAATTKKGQDKKAIAEEAKNKAVALLEQAKQAAAEAQEAQEEAEDPAWEAETPAAGMSTRKKRARVGASSA